MSPLLRPLSTGTAGWAARALCAAASLTTIDAWGQPTATEQSAADVTMARQLGNEGLSLASEGNCAAAVDLLSRSESMHHAPTTLAVLGECHITLGKLVEGAEELTRVVRENIDPLAPAAFRTAQDGARVRLEETRPRVPKLRLVVHGASADSALTVRLDGEVIPAASLGLERPVDPGPHRVQVTARGYQPATGELTSREGGSQELTLELVRLPETEFTDTETSEVSAKVSPAYPASSQRRPSRTPAYVAFGISAAGIAAGTAFGLITLSKTASLDKLCPTRSTCPASAQSEIDISNATAWTSTISFGVSAVALFTGLYFALRGPRSERATATQPTSGPTLYPRIGFGSVGFDGSF
jgi:hypothetical protein